MDFLPQNIEQFVMQYSSPESEVLAKLNRETWSKMIQPRMLSGHIQGRVLSMLSQMIQPGLVLEIGTFTGYSAICLAEGLTANGMLYTIDVNEELEDMVHRYVSEAGMAEKIKMLIGDATHIIPQIKGTFDLVFIDADKENYSNYFDLIFDRLRPGGFIIADNVLWSGKVVEKNPDAETGALIAYCKKVQADRRVENVLLSVRDGLMICRKL